MNNWLLYITTVMPWIITGFLLCFLALIVVACMKHSQK
jgi:hypothetical protein